MKFRNYIVLPALDIGLAVGAISRKKDDEPMDPTTYIMLSQFAPN